MGAGYAGLGAALRLSAAGVRPVILEAGSEAGGLARCVEVGGQILEAAYHHLKPEDVDVLELIHHFGLAADVRWTRTRMGFFSGGRLHAFSGPFDLLRFEPFSVAERLRFGLGILRIRHGRSEDLIGRSAEEWIQSVWGLGISRKMLRPMLINKFGIDPSEISAAFLHGRMKGLSSSKSAVASGERLAILRGGLDRLTRRIVERLEPVAELRTGSPVRSIARSREGFRLETPAGTVETREVLSTLPMTVLARLARGFEIDHSIRYQGAICGIFALERLDLPFYWVNVIDEDLTCRVLVNQTVLDDYPCGLVYLANYTTPDSKLYRTGDEEIRELYLRDLSRIVGPVRVLDAQISRTPVATPVFDRDFGRRLEQLDAGLPPGLTVAGSLRVFPGTRTISSALRNGYAAAADILARVDG